MEVRELITKLGFSFDGKNANVYENKISSIKKAGLSLSTTLKTAFAGVTVAAIGAMVKSTLNFGDELLVASQITGIAVDNLTNLRIAAKLANVEQGELTASLTIFSTKLANAKAGNDSAVKSFTDLGINLAGIKTTDQGFKAASEALTKMKDGFEKTAAARELFGRGGGKLVALFQKDSGELKKYISVIDAFGKAPSKNFVEQSDRINDKLEIMQMILPRLRNTIVQGFYPAIEGVIDRFMEWASANKTLINQKIDVVIKTVEKAVRVAFVAIKDFTTGISFLWGKLKEYPVVLQALGIAFGAAAISAAPLTATIAGIALLLEDLDAYTKGNKSLLGPYIMDAVEGWQKFYDLIKGVYEQLGIGPKLKKEASEYSANVDKWRAERDNFIGPQKESTKDKIARLWNQSVNQYSNSGLTNLSQNLNSAAPILSSWAPSPAQIMQAGTTVKNTVTVKSSPNITVNVNASQEVDGNAVVDKIKKVTEETLVNHYRTAFLNGQGIEGR